MFYKYISNVHFSNKFFHNFHLSESVLLVQGFGQVVWREDWFKSYLFICNFASFINYEWANDYWLWPCEQFLKIYHGENKITFCWDDNTCFVQDHAAHQVWFLYTSLARMKKKTSSQKDMLLQSTPGTLSLTPSHQAFVLAS